MFFQCSQAFLTLRYTIQVNAVNSLFKNLKAFGTYNNRSAEEEVKYKPDVVIYKGDLRNPPSVLTSFQRMEMFVEFRHGNNSDPFGIYDESSWELLENARSTRRQITLYSTRQQAYQFRTSVLTVGIFGTVVRFFRWDRTDSKVSVPIDYSTAEGNRHLTEFFTRFNLMSPEARGWDPTVKDATEKEIEDFDEAIRKVCQRPKREAEGDNVDLLFSKLAESVGRRDQYPRKQVSVLDGKKTKYYIVGRPTSVVKLPTGRATRGFVAMSMETKRLVFLKDSWRPDVGGIEAEDHWHSILRTKRVKRIGAFSHGSDVYGTKSFIRCHDKKQRTLNLYAKENGELETMGFIHYRSVQPELYLPLETFKSSKHLTSVMLDIALGTFSHYAFRSPVLNLLLAIEHVHDAGLFHGDLSPGNIMVDIRGCGRLIDFDMARYRDKTGTWQALRAVGFRSLPFRVELVAEHGWLGHMAVHVDQAAHLPREGIRGFRRARIVLLRYLLRRPPLGHTQQTYVLECEVYLRPDGKGCRRQPHRWCGEAKLV